MKLTITGLADRVTTEGEAYAYLESLRWPTGDPNCPHCGAVGADYIRPANGVSRKTRTGAMSERRVWRCGGCRKQYSVLTGTIMHGTKISVRKWVFVIFEMCSSKNGVSAREIQRKYGIACRSAWFMMHRIRESMRSDAIIESMRGTIVADETWIGGEPRFRHGAKAESTTPVRIVPGHGNVHTDKTAVLSLINADTGEVRSRVVPDVTGATLRKVIAEHVDTAGSVLYTDKSKSYIGIGREFLAHEAVDHEAGEYVRYEDGKTITSNQAENFFSQLKRSIDGTHHHVSVEHLPRYLAEFDYRHSTRKMSDTARMRDLMARTGGRRLTYRSVAS